MLTGKMKGGVFVVVVLSLSAFAVAAEGDAAAKKSADRELVVRVTDGDGKPVADAEVYFLDDSIRVAAKGRTDAEGRWTGRVPADVKRWGVFARKGKVGFDYAVAAPRRGTRDKLHTLPDRLNLTLDGARTLRVKTVDRQGKPIPNVKVGPWYIQKPGNEGDIILPAATGIRPKTDKDGVAILDWLPIRFEHSIPIFALSDDYYDIRYLKEKMS